MLLLPRPLFAKDSYAPKLIKVLIDMLKHAWRALHDGILAYNLGITMSLKKSLKLHQTMQQCRPCLPLVVLPLVKSEIVNL